MTSPSSLGLRFQFESREQQRAAAETGMWMFLATEVLMFGSLFTAWAVYRMWYPVPFAIASNRMDLSLGAANTAVLLTSSLMMALAVLGSQLGRRWTIVLFLLLTLLLGAAFLGVKAFEYGHHYAAGEMPGFNWTYAGEASAQVQMFFVFYYAITGLHALHMVIGLGLLAVLALRAVFGRFDAVYHTPVEMTGLYWHFVDIVWVFLFPMFYLTGRHLH